MKMSIDDPQFAERIREEDPEALRAVVTSYLGQIHRAARRAGLDGAAGANGGRKPYSLYNASESIPPGRPPFGRDSAAVIG